MGAAQHCLSFLTPDLTTKYTSSMRERIGKSCFCGAADPRTEPVRASALPEPQQVLFDSATASIDALPACYERVT